jgi:hypothetical protein
MRMSDRTQMWRVGVQYAAIVVFTILISVQVLYSWRGPSAPQLQDAGVALDFKTFYCAGAATNAGEDPYLAQAVKRCGSKPPAAPPPFARANVWPAPLPAYDIAIFRLLAELPYRLAVALWMLASIIALSIAVVLISKLSAIPPIAIFAALAMPLYYTCLQWGQLPPLIVGSLAIAAYGMSKQAYTVAAFACVACAIEPHVGAPVCLAAFLWERRCRLPIAVGVGILAIVSIGTLGLATNIEYFQSVLPLQARAEVPATNQFSFTSIAYTFGAPDRLAVELGSIDYVLMAAIGVYLARRISRATDVKEAIPLVPAMAVLLGGAFVHVTQLSIAIAAGIALSRLMARQAALLWSGVLLMMPVSYDVALGRHALHLTRVESMVALAVVAFVGFAKLSTPGRLGAVLAALAAYFAISFAIVHAPSTTIRTPASAIAYERQLGADMKFAAAEWGVYIRETPQASTTTWQVIVAKSPWWFGLILLLAGIVSIDEAGPLSGAREAFMRMRRRIRWHSGPSTS